MFPSRSADRYRREIGFTLIELVLVIIILAVLAAMAVPAFINMGTSARVASLKSLAGTINSTAINVHVLCKTNPLCDYTNSSQFLIIGGQEARLNYGWLDAGDVLGLREIDAWITYDGFTATLPYYYMTRFSLDGAPDPINCSVSYVEAFGSGAASGAVVTLVTTGC